MLGSRTSGYLLQPASQPARHSHRIRSPEGLSETRRSKKEAKKEEKSIGTVRDLVLLGLLTNRESLALRITRAASREIELRSQLDNFLAAPPLVAFSGSSAFSSLVSAAALLYLYNCWFHGLARFSSMHPLFLSLHGCCINSRMHATAESPKRATREMAPEV
ncbi:hypothetical protein H112_05008 [Trichophyton rubrum D6]|uniref:Uncharacterized protein n=2 Tax=Trichophyton TaxID=5550 RepID=A0A022VZJ1_TRIRU|nr:hypothetical protein H100_05031 [Trichophyton rubrum MR850]EZF41005.1 hypothetical protein H102_05017 [Trichophyton rubrum CBS 100081]EZF51511.1 hypothetical protein H103_05019 [Trichophyton rubrum CBS 288.86]EZF62256.1 hypothetical protein H104_05012 [Trichophyton rubrum CBS 289.86]EZF72755.1 hypothetical protein H105_05038 [Trichophyton soudanense CBS 452.61]EZF83670.1 hypothetical protein H110_05018 [Trichophyton rubrum MR1448]EZF94411.1 hypothetical protein H113_05060 [Trichophyton rub